MAVIRDYHQGACHIIVHDDCIRPPEEVKKIIARVSEIVINEEFRKYMARKNQGQDPGGDGNRVLGKEDTQDPGREGRQAWESSHS